MCIDQLTWRPSLISKCFSGVQMLSQCRKRLLCQRGRNGVQSTSRLACQCGGESLAAIASGRVNEAVLRPNDRRHIATATRRLRDHELPLKLGSMTCPDHQKALSKGSKPRPRVRVRHCKTRRRDVPGAPWKAKPPVLAGEQPREQVSQQPTCRTSIFQQFARLRYMRIRRPISTDC